MKCLLILTTLLGSVSATAFAQSDTLLHSINTEKPAKVFQLDKTLAEISGLVAAGPDSVFAHNDEYAIIHEVSLKDGAVLRSFALGKPTVEGDFEGVALLDEFIYLVTSDGLIYEARPNEHRKRAAYNVYDTGLGKTCEIEGVTNDTDGGLLLLCKRSTLNKNRNRLIIYRWTYADRLTPPGPWLNISLRGLAPTPAEGAFRASGLERDPKTGHLLVLDSNAGAVLEITPDGARANYQALEARRHPQSEGVAILKNGDMAVADEGGKKTGRLTLYTAR